MLLLIGLALFLHPGCFCLAYKLTTISAQEAEVLLLRQAKGLDSRNSSNLSDSEEHVTQRTRCADLVPSGWGLCIYAGPHNASFASGLLKIYHIQISGLYLSPITTHTSNLLSVDVELSVELDADAPSSYLARFEGHIF